MSRTSSVVQWQVPYPIATHNVSCGAEPDKVSEPVYILAKSRQLSLAALLLCLGAGIGLCATEPVCRTTSGARVRSAKAIRLDDHEHDQSVEGLVRASELHSASHSGIVIAGLPPGSRDIPSTAFVGSLQSSRVPSPNFIFRSASRSRGPPSNVR